jgi:hypothetical protein
MTHGRGLCSDTNWSKKEARNRTAVTVDEDHGNESLRK